MMRAIQIGILAGAACAWAADQKEPAKPAPRPAPVRPPKALPKGGGIPKAGPGLTNPANPFTRLYRATPEERERVLERMPAAQQERVRNNLAWFDSQKKDDQQIILQRSERFDALAPDKKQEFREQFVAFQKLPKERHQPIAVALRRLQMMPDQQRSNILNSEQFRSRFSVDELNMIGVLSEVMLPPM